MMALISRNVLLFGNSMMSRVYDVAVRTSFLLSSRAFSSTPIRNLKQTCVSLNVESSTFNEAEVNKFREYANEWWNVNGELGALHSLNSLRVPLIRDALLRKTTPSSLSLPLVGMKVLDVGCGGGILSEPLARLGANVVGIDASSENIEVARCHAEEDCNLSGQLEYICGTVEEHKPPELYDAVVSSEVIEHVDNQEYFLSVCCELVKPGGSVIITTLNRNLRSYIGGILIAENLLRIVSPGTHDWNKFVTPSELMGMLDRQGCTVRLIHGMFYTPLINKWCWFPDTGINYAVHAVKRIVPASINSAEQ